MHPFQTRSFGARNRDQVTRCMALSSVLIGSLLTNTATEMLHSCQK